MIDFHVLNKGVHIVRCPTMVCKPIYSVNPIISRPQELQYFQPQLLAIGT